MRGFQRQAELCRDASRAVLAEQEQEQPNRRCDKSGLLQACMHMQQIKIELSICAILLLLKWACTIY